MKLVVVAVGKLKERAFRELADEYLGRIQRYVRCEEIEVSDPSALARRAPSEAHRVALEVGGQSLSSEGLAKRLERLLGSNKKAVVFFIGGAEGIPSDLSESADLRLSLSSLTLPHRLARVVLYEQLYRSMTILRGEPYAREG